MSNLKVLGLEEAQAILAANITPRARTLDEFEREVEGTRFDHLPDWTADKPIYEKRPCVIYHAVDSSINSKQDLLLGQGRFPTITSRPDEDEDDEVEDALDADASERLDKLMLSVIREAKLKPFYRETYGGAQGCGTCVGIGGVRNGRLFAETLPAKFAVPNWDQQGNLTRVEIEYPYIKTERSNDGWKATCYLYRRVIDAQTDTVFKPGVANKDATPPKWAVQEATPHGLGFVPIKWYKHNAPQQNIASYDGKPVHATILPELHQIHLALSQRQHGALNALPQLVEIGVQPGYNPTAAGDTGMAVQVTEFGGSPNPQSNPVRGEYRTQPSRGIKGARKKGPNHVYQYESPDTKVEAIDTPGDALKALDENIKDLRNKICETLAWVPLDPDSIKFAATVSGKALEILRERELNRVCQDRETFGEDMILGMMCMLLRIATVKAKELRTPRLKQCLGDLQKFVGPDGQWQDPLFTIKWPAFFVPSPEDEKNEIDMTAEAFTQGLITKRTAVEKVSRIFGISNIDEYLETLEEEKTQRDADEMKQQAQAMAEFHKASDGNGQRPPGRGNAPKGPPGGGGGSRPIVGNSPKT